MGRITEEDLEDWQSDKNYRVQDMCREIRASWQEIKELKAENEYHKKQLKFFDEYEDNDLMKHDFSTLHEENNTLKAQIKKLELIKRRIT